ncbi:hypothetical protein DPMN_128674 [Dreissena polymorpha]|uniref:Uncharacterized protein n=1 Tax=Dreissena polymorpha TaxID=45954 RepID=A0A9D4GZZ1_DREPO|nr:hypothetical protein DPMN_128674 [Dreissena polymorpha]
MAYEASVPQAQPAHLRNPSMGYPAYLKHSLRTCAIRAWATQRTSSTACAPAQSEHGYEASVPQAQPAHLRNPSMGYAFLSFQRTLASS